MQCVSCYVSLILTAKSISNRLIFPHYKDLREFLDRVALNVKTQLRLLILSLLFKEKPCQCAV